jgi:hypothetical protein
MMETNRKMSSGLEFHLGKRFSVEIQARRSTNVVVRKTLVFRLPRAKLNWNKTGGVKMDFLLLHFLRRIH